MKGKNQGITQGDTIGLCVSIQITHGGHQNGVLTSPVRHQSTNALPNGIHLLNRMFKGRVQYLISFSVARVWRVTNEVSHNHRAENFRFNRWGRPVKGVQIHSPIR